MSSLRNTLTHFVLVVVTVTLLFSAQHQQHFVKAQTIPCPENGPDQCQPHGQCVPEGYCICHESPAKGYWEGQICDVCKHGWAGQDCTAECRGGACTPCNLHGTCNQGRDGDGSCECFKDQMKGFWGGAECAQCSPSFYGFYCNQTCPGIDRSRGVSCFGHGTCSDDVTGTGTCSCDDGFGRETNCADCDGSHYGPSCTSLCEGYVHEGADRGKPCSGHGTCQSGISGDGSCVCDPQYGGSTCSAKCPNNCTYPFGICLDGASRGATCECDAVHAPDDCSTCIATKTGPSCDLDCPTTSEGLICNNRGNCSHAELTQEAICTCVDGYIGDTCETPCPGNPPCSGHGRCKNDTSTLGQPACECYADDQRGHWHGATCDTCHPDFGVSTTCQRRCPMGGPNLNVPCSSHGQCVEGECICERFNPTGHDYCGDACEIKTVIGAVDNIGKCVGCTCVYCSERYHSGFDCSKKCEGYTRFIDGREEVCHNQGTCREGINAEGSCACNWGFTGATCTLPCPVNPANNQVCSGISRGKCVAINITMNETTGETVPDNVGGRSPDIEPNMTAVCECLDQFGGNTCELTCPTVTGLVCAGHGVCNRSFNGDAKCVCDRQWTGHSCNVQCGCLSEFGECDHAACESYTADKVCTICQCYGNFTGQCDVCRDGTQGPRCEGACVHGKTVGKVCICEANYSTAACDVYCPTSTINGKICSGRGTCNWGYKQSGVCTCDPPNNPIYFGTACEIFCTRDICRRNANLLNPQCNPKTGQCECQDDDDGHWVGELCNVCKGGYWGPTCSTRCQCNDRGTCDIDSGKCKCFSSETQGFFAGSVCSSCAAGYVGLECRQKNTIYTRMQRKLEASHDNVLPADLIEALQPSTETPSPGGPPSTPAPTVGAGVLSQFQPAPQLLVVDQSPSRMNLYVSGSPVIKMNVFQTVVKETLSTADAAVRSAESFGCSLDMGEAAYAWISGASVFFVMQPSPLCRRGLRVVQVDRADRDTSFVTTKQHGDQEWLDNTTVRVIASSADEGDSYTSEARPLMVAFLLAQFSGPGGTGTQYPGGFVLLVDIDAMEGRGPEANNPIQILSKLALPEDFIAKDISYSAADGHIAVAGARLFGDDGTTVWDVLLLRKLSNTFAPAFGDPATTTLETTSFGSIKSKIPCWGVPELQTEDSNTAEGGVSRVALTAADSCSACMSAEKVEFYPFGLSSTTSSQNTGGGGTLPSSKPKSSLLIGIHKESLGSPRVLWIRNIEDFNEGETLAVPLATPRLVPGVGTVIADECRVARVVYDPVLEKNLMEDSTNRQLQHYTPHTFAATLLSLDAAETEITAMAFDPSSNVTHVALKNIKSSQASRILKVRIGKQNDFALYGQLFLSHITPKGTSVAVPEIVSKIAIDASRRLLYALLTGLEEVRLITLFLFEVYDTVPDVSDQRGGTIVEVRGSGFQTVLNVTDKTNPIPYGIMCKFGDDFAPAIETSFTHVKCRATAVSEEEGTETCQGQPVEISLYGSTTDEDTSVPTLWHTNDAVTINRVQNPKIESVEPKRGGIAGFTTVTLLGQGFVSSTFSVCRFWSSNPQSTEVLQSPLQFVSDRQVLCEQPPALNASYHPGLVDVAIDGQIFNDPPALYDIIGRATDLESPSTITISAQLQTNFSVGVHMIDEQQHRLLTIDGNYTRRIELSFTNITRCNPSVFQWFGNQTESQGGYPSDPCRDTDLNVTSQLWTRNTTDGFIEFDDIYVLLPRVDRFQLTFTDVDSKWFTTTTVVVVEGDPHALFLWNYEWYLGRGGTPVPHEFEDEKELSPKPQVMVVDQLANQVPFVPGLFVEGRTFYVNDTNNDIVFAPGMYVQAQQGREVEFENIILPFLHGASHYVNFSSSSHPFLKSITTPTIRTQICEGKDAYYKVPNTGVCLPCPGGGGAICDGTETIIVKPQYWRASENLTNIYKCDVNSFNCKGEPVNESDYSTICQEGYKGPLCTVCIDGWGKSIGRTCDVCPAEGDAIRNMVLIGLGGIIALLAWTIIVMRDAELTPITIILRTVVNHMQATGSIGEFSNQWDPFLKSIFEVQQSGSSMSFSGLSSLDCLIRNNGYEYDAIFVLYMLLPSIGVVLSAIVFLVVRAAGLKPAITDKLKEQLLEETHDSPDAPNGEILHRYPFAYVLVPTISIFMFSVYQTLITESTSVLKCRELVIDSSGVPHYFIDRDMSMECTGPAEHRFRSVAMMCAFCYGVGVPLFFMLSYKFVISRSGNRDLANVMFLFMVGGYKDQFWFWQAVIMVRKLALVGIIVFVEDNKDLQSYAAVWAMNIALVLQIWFNPNEKDEHNQVEALSLALLTTTMNLGLLYIWPDLPEFAINALTATLILITLGAVVMFVYFIVMSVLPDIKMAIGMAQEMLEERRNGKTAKADHSAIGTKIKMYDDEELLEQERLENDGPMEIGVNLNRFMEAKNGASTTTTTSSGEQKDTAKNDNDDKKVVSSSTNGTTTASSFNTEHLPRIALAGQRKAQKTWHRGATGLGGGRKLNRSLAFDNDGVHGDGNGGADDDGLNFAQFDDDEFTQEHFGLSPNRLSSPTNNNNNNYSSSLANVPQHHQAQHQQPLPPPRFGAGGGSGVPNMHYNSYYSAFEDDDDDLL